MADVILYRRGFRTRGLPDAESTSAELARIREKNDGLLSSRKIVDASRSKRAVFHKYLYALDDVDAADKHRLYLAQTLLRCVVVIKEELPDLPVRQYEISHAYTPGERHYETMDEMLADPEKRAILLQRALNELLAVRRKFHHLQELSIVFREVQKVREDMDA